MGLKKGRILAVIIVVLAYAIVLLIQNPGPNVRDNEEWSLRVDGLVQNPLSLSFDELLAMPKTTVYAKIYRMGAPDNVIEEGNWTGVRLGLLLQNAGVSSGAIKVAFFASDGYATDLTVQDANDENIIVAYEKDGKRLIGITKEGPSVRLVVPGRWGYKWIQDLIHIEIVDYDFKGRLENQGNSDTGIISTG